MPVLVNLHLLDKKDLALEGELTAKDLGLDESDELVRLRKSLHYDLTVQNMEHAILVRGSLSARLDCECARCLKKFEEKLELPDWTALLPLDGNEKIEVKDDSVDLTPIIREDILLAFPQHPLCDSDCAGLVNRPKEKAKKSDASSAWSELNKIKFK